MKRENPLLIYRNWFIELGLSLADRIAQATFQAMAHHQPLYSQLLKQDAFRTPGLLAISMLEVINHQIDFGENISIPQFAMTLFVVTQGILQGEEQPEAYLIEECKDHFLKNLVDGNQKETNYFESLLQQVSLVLDYNNHWEKLAASGFDLTAIGSYRIGNVSN